MGVTAASGGPTLLGYHHRRGLIHMQFMGSPRVLIACAALVVFALAGASHAPRATAVGEARTILVPQQGALFGAWTKPRSGRTVQQELAYTEQQIGRRFDIFNLYYH